jgi:hypothetical protein
MKFLPTENITYKTKLKEEEIVGRLSDLIEPEKAFRFRIFSSGLTKPYEGQIKGGTFDIKRIIGYRNSFLPRINGIIEKDDDGIRIKVKMRLHIFIIVFLCFWCGVVGLACVAILTLSFGDSEFNPATFIPFGMLLFAYGLTMGAFKFESNKSKKDLQRIFEAEIIE